MKRSPMKSDCRQSLIHSVINGISRANNDYFNMSGEWVSDRGVESFVSSYVAKDIRSNIILNSGRVLLEVSVKDALENYAQRYGSDRNKFSNLRQRFDIVVLNKNDELYGVVEIKRDKYYGNWKKDVERVSEVVRYLQSGQGKVFGCFAGFVVEEDGEDEIEEVFSMLRKCCLGLKQKEDTLFRLVSDYQKIEGDKWRFGILGCLFEQS